MEKKFLECCQTAAAQAQTLGVAIRPVTMESAHRCLSGHRASDGFARLAQLDRLDLSLEALSVSKQFTGLFSDEEANNALMRLLDAGYRF